MPTREYFSKWLRGRDNHNLFPHCRPRYPQRDAIHPRPVQSLPPLRAFLRNEGIDTDIEPRQPCPIGATHEVAREEARRRALRAAATRYGFVEHTKAQSHCLSSAVMSGWAQFWVMNTVTVLLLMGNQLFGLWTKVAGWDITEGWLSCPQSGALANGGPQELLQRTFVTLPESS
jgi:hypothetical protein